MRAQVLSCFLTLEPIIDASDERQNSQLQGQCLVGCHVPFGSQKGTSDVTLKKARERANSPLAL